MTTPAPGMLNVEQQAIQTALQSLEGQIAAMISSGQTVERINMEIAANYVSGASRAFQEKVNDWVTQYKQVMSAFDKLTQDLGSARQILVKAEEDAHVQGGNWGASDGVYHALGGTS
ncbi:hypothetical protein PUR71_37180 [Streptomyces sp. SP17BM10]|uniref:hypothetical protein n=1 Tax=Streptomyces sp. SP17BM10 TaxID=3002530 RepID=UPI002E7621B2|nr:hypothetical protein [Streptomyces sp. SP17BM10]MEE1788494.1 hypothetical protein [Streptomyces sp. SP17BM10]